MAIKNKKIEPIPEEFGSYEEAAEFWATHDTTDYPDALETIQFESSFQGRQYEIEIPEELVLSLRQKAPARCYSQPTRNHTFAATHPRTAVKIVSRNIQEHNFYCAPRAGVLESAHM